MNKPNKIIIHCSGTLPSDNIDANSIRRYHVEHNKWNDIGYHYVITTKGEIQKGRDDTVIGSHCKGYNTNSLGICLVGGIKDKDDKMFNKIQFKVLKDLIKELKEKYGDLTVHGHYEFTKLKTCPNFNVKEFMEQ